MDHRADVAVAKEIGKTSEPSLNSHSDIALSIDINIRTPERTTCYLLLSSLFLFILNDRLNVEGKGGVGIHKCR